MYDICKSSLCLTNPRGSPDPGSEECGPSPVGLVEAVLRENRRHMWSHVGNVRGTYLAPEGRVKLILPRSLTRTRVHFRSRSFCLGSKGCKRFSRFYMRLVFPEFWSSLTSLTFIESVVTISMHFYRFNF